MISQDGDPTARILDEVDGLAARMVDTLAEAIAVPSINPRYPGQEYSKVVGAEGEMSALLADLYAEAGADLTTVTVERGRDNVVGVLPGAGGGRSLLLNGHVDVVPPGRLDRWHGDPFRAVVTGDRVTGRGAETRVTDACRRDPWLRAHPPVFEWKLLWPPYALPDDAPIAATVAHAHATAAGQVPLTTGFMGVCDLTWMDRKDIGGLVYGPGVGYTAHAENEYVEIAQLVQSAKTYALTAVSWCGLAATG